MPRGAPDYSNVRAYGPLHRLDDMAELAVRLGSIDVFDRRGNVILIEDFNHGLAGWTTNAWGGDSAVTLDTTVCRFPPHAIKMYSDGHNAGQTRISKYVPPQVIGKIGLEVSVALPTDYDYFMLTMQRGDGSTIYTSIILFNATTGKLQYLDSGGVYQDFATLPDIPNAYGLYYSCKMVVDFATKKYERFMLAEDTWNLSAYSIRELAIPVTLQLLIMLDHGARTDNDDYCYVDAVIVTQNEPSELEV